MPLPSKSELRRHLLAQRAALHASDKRLADAVIVENTLSCAIPHKEAIISGYMPFRAEPDILPALATLEQRGAHLCLPVITRAGKPLSFHAWRRGAPLHPNAYGIAEPSPEAPEVFPNLLLLPMLAFDRQGTRLGYGGGYYDRTLRTLREINPTLLAIGIAYDMQQRTALPRDAHDMPLDMAITEKTIYDFQGLR